MKTLEEALKLHSDGKWGKAESAYRALLRKTPTEDVFYNLAALYYQQGRDTQAIDTLKEALILGRASARILSILALSQERIGDIKNALRHAKQGTEVATTDSVVWNNYGKVLLTAGELEQSRDALQKSLELNPNYPEAKFNYALTLGRLGSARDAIHELEELVFVYPHFYEAHLNLVALHSDNGNGPKAEEHLKEAIRITVERDNIPKECENIALTIASLINVPVIYESQEEIKQSRDRLIAALERAEEDLRNTKIDKITKSEKLFLLVFFRLSNFSWGYQGYNDLEINSRYVAILRKCLPRYVDKEKKSIKSAKHSQGLKRRVVVISEYFGLHATTWIGELLKRVDQSLIETTYIVVNDWKDKNYVNGLNEFASLEFQRCNEDNFGIFFEALRSADFDLLIYPDVGMTAFSRVASSFRLAKKQAVHWAHPVTTGSPAVDFFITGEAMEPQEAEEHYSESLVRLPGIGLYLEKWRSGAGLAKNNHRSEFKIVTIQSLFKYLPTQDTFFVELCQLIPTAVLYFIEHPDSGISERFMNRIRRSFREQSIDPNRHLKLVPRMNRNDLLDFLSGADIYLDSFGWSGGNTTLDAIEAGCPVYTVPGSYMRGRHTYGILEQMGVEDGICADLQELKKKLELASIDTDHLNQFRLKIERARSLLFERNEVLSAFKDFLVSELNKKPPHC